MDSIRLSAAMARTGLCVVEIVGRRIRHARTKCHVRTPGIVMRNPRFQKGSQMRLGKRNQPIQTLTPNRTDDSFADRISHRTARWRFEYPDSEPFYRFVQVLGENAVAIVKQIFVPVLGPDGLAQLLQRPGGSRMGGDAAMNQTAGK